MTLIGHSENYRRTALSTVLLRPDDHRATCLIAADEAHRAGLFRRIDLDRFYVRRGERAVRGRAWTAVDRGTEPGIPQVAVDVEVRKTVCRRNHRWMHRDAVAQLIAIGHPLARATAAASHRDAGSLDQEVGDIGDGMIGNGSPVEAGDELLLTTDRETFIQPGVARDLILLIGDDGRERRRRIHDFGDRHGVAATQQHLLRFEAELLQFDDCGLSAEDHEIESSEAGGSPDDAGAGEYVAYGHAVDLLARPAVVHPEDAYLLDGLVLRVDRRRRSH